MEVEAEQSWGGFTLPHTVSASPRWRCEEAAVSSGGTRSSSHITRSASVVDPFASETLVKLVQALKLSEVREQRWQTALRSVQEEKA